MSKQWWSSRPVFIAQAGCLLVLFAWSVHRAPGVAAVAAPAVQSAAPEREAVIDNSEDTASADTTGEVEGRFVAPPTIHFRTENPPAGSLNLRPLDVSIPENSAPWQPVHPQNPPRRLPGGTRSPFEVRGSGATVYNAPPLEAE